MDNVTHSLVGWALAETGLKRRTRFGTAACILAANMPDIDVFFGWAPWPPLAMHRGFTHGLVGGVLLMPPVLAVLLWLLGRWRERRGRAEAGGPPLRLGWLVLLCYLGALTHPLLDLQNTYAVQLLSPASTRWFHTDGLFIISPYLLAMLGAGIAIARRRSRAGQPGGTAAVLALAGVAGFIAVNVGISSLAWRAPSRSAPYAHPDRVFAAPGVAAFWRRDVVWREKGRIAFGRYDPLRNATGLVDHRAGMADNMDDPLVRRAARLSPAAAKFLAWSQLPFARIEPMRCTARVTFGDARFLEAGRVGAFTVPVDLPVNGRGCPLQAEASAAARAGR